MMTKKCQECNKDYDGIYCKPCNSRHFQDNFPNWTSGNANIDNLIQESQLNANSQWQFLEWINYSNLKDIQHIAEGGFGSVYKAIWEDGPTTYKWNDKKSEWIRKSKTAVVIEKYRNVTSVTSEFLDKVKKLE